MSEHYELVIIGSGPAGLTASIYTARANLAPLLIEGETIGTDQPGGQLMLTTDIENYPGFVNGITGPELMERMRAQAERFGTQIVTKRVTRVDLSTSPFKVWTGEVGNEEASKTTEPEYTASALIISTGARALTLGVPGERELMGYGVSTCATCDGFFFRGKPIAVVGGGDSAMEEANFLTRFAEKVTLIHRRDEFRASKIMQDRLFANPKVEVRYNTVISSVEGEGKVERLKLKDTVTGQDSEIEVAGMFVAIGHAPNTELFKGQLDLEDNGYLITEKGSTRTSVDGVFACGDVQDHTYRQAITAAGSGCMAAIDAERWLEAQHG